MILAETGIHGIVSITDNGTANRDIYVESEQEIGGLLESAGVDQVDYRTAIVNPLVRNEEILYQLNGMSMYSSTNTEEMWNFVKNMGFENLENRFQYAGSTEVMDMLLGIRYLFCRNTRTLHTAYKRLQKASHLTCMKIHGLCDPDIWSTILCWIMQWKEQTRLKFRTVCSVVL